MNVFKSSKSCCCLFPSILAYGDFVNGGVFWIAELKPDKEHAGKTLEIPCNESLQGEGTK